MARFFRQFENFFRDERYEEIFCDKQYDHERRVEKIDFKPTEFHGRAEVVNEFKRHAVGIEDIEIVGVPVE